MSLLYFLSCLSLLISGALSVKNALHGFDVQMLSDPKAPRIILVNEKGHVTTDILSVPAITVCFYAYFAEKAGKAHNTLISYISKANKENDELLIIADVKVKEVVVALAGKKYYFETAIPINKWTMVCASWSAETKEIRAYFDGVELGVKTEAKNITKIGKDGIFVVGQDQDDPDASYEAGDGVYGRMSQVNVWSKVLTPKEVRKVIDGKLYGNIVDWRESSWALAGNAVLIPTDAPNAALQQSTCGGKEDTVATDLTVCLRFNGDSFNQETFPLFYYMNSYGTNELALIINNDRSINIMTGIEKRNVPHLSVSQGLQHWCFVWSRDSLQVYIDGGLYDTLEDFTEGTKMSSNGDLYVHAANSRKRVASKSMDNRVWERALSSEEVAEEFKSISPKIYHINAGGIGNVPESPAYVRRIWQRAPMEQFVTYY